MHPILLGFIFLLWPVAGLAAELPYDAATHYRRGIALEQQGNRAEAIIRYRKALQLNPNYFEARLRLADHLFKIGKFEEAESEYRKATRIRPNNSNAHYMLALSIHKQGLADSYYKTKYDPGKLRKAIAEYREAIRINPDDADIYVSMGNAFYSLDSILDLDDSTTELDEAIKLYKEALIINPNHDVARERLSDVIERKNYQRSLRTAVEPREIGLRKLRQNHSLTEEQIAFGIEIEGIFISDNNDKPLAAYLTVDGKSQCVYIGEVIRRKGYVISLVGFSHKKSTVTLSDGKGHTAIIGSWGIIPQVRATPQVRAPSRSGTGLPTVAPRPTLPPPTPPPLMLGLSLIEFTSQEESEDPAAVLDVDGNSQVVRVGDVIRRPGYIVKIIGIDVATSSVTLSDGQGHTAVLQREKR